MLGFGVALAAMNLTFYEAIDRIPLGAAVTLEFVGPLTVAVLGSRRALDLLWVTLAAAGILALADLGGGSIDALGAGLALLAGVFWGSYILLSERVGQVFPGGAGLALAMLLGALVLLPVSSAIPYSLELEALRRLPSGVFGVLMSTEPAMAALAGVVVLGEGLSTRELVAIALVVVASAGAARRAARETMPRD